MITNSSNISLPMAIWLAADNYNLAAHPNVISATGLLKPLKSIILTQRILKAQLENDVDLQDLIAARLGTAIHTAVELAWANNLESALIAMGFPKKARELIKVNPKLPLDPEKHNVFIEQRNQKEIEGMIVSGQYDFVENGRVKDIKSTSVYTWIHDSKTEDYCWQGSIYRWLNPEIITDDYIDIEFLFTDWKAMESIRDKSYPPRRIMSRSIPLKSLAETEQFIRKTIQNLKNYKDKPQHEIPPCTSKELWQKPKTYAYFRKVNNKRATKTYKTDEYQQALDRMVSDGSTGHIETRPGSVKFCNYCTALPICKQAESYIQNGLLVV